MDKKKKIWLSILLVLFIIMVSAGLSYAFFIGSTSEKDLDTKSGEVKVIYSIHENVNANELISSDTKEGGLKSVVNAKLDTTSVPAAFNIYITPSIIEGLNISALKWEVIGTNNNEVVYTNNGDFSSASAGNSIIIVDKYDLKTTDTTFDIYIWLDAKLLTESLDNKRFVASISSDSIQITGEY